MALPTPLPLPLHLTYFLLRLSKLYLHWPHLVKFYRWEINLSHVAKLYRTNSPRTWGTHPTCSQTLPRPQPPLAPCTLSPQLEARSSAMHSCRMAYSPSIAPVSIDNRQHLLKNSFIVRLLYKALWHLVQSRWSINIFRMMNIEMKE